MDDFKCRFCGEQFDDKRSFDLHPCPATVSQAKEGYTRAAHPLLRWVMLIVAAGLIAFGIHWLAGYAPTQPETEKDTLRLYKWGFQVGILLVGGIWVMKAPLRTRVMRTIAALAAVAALLVFYYQKLGGL